MPEVLEQPIREFEHDGFSCKSLIRNDILYMKQVIGFKGDMVTPAMLFDNSMSFEQAEEGFRSVLDGTFSGKMETVGHYSFCVSL